MNNNLLKLCTFQTRLASQLAMLPLQFSSIGTCQSLKTHLKFLKNKASLQTNRSVQMGSILEHAARQPVDKEVRQEDIIGW